MPATWRPIPYEVWSATCDTLHAHAQVLGKLAAALAPPEPQLQHAALRLSGRGWETLPLPAPDGSGAFLVALDLQNHHAVAEHSDGRSHHVPLGPNRPVGTVTKEVLAAVTDLVGPVPFDPTPQEVPWTTALDEDEIHFTYNPNQVTEYFAAATQARARAGGGACPVPGTIHAGQRLVGKLRPRGEPVFRQGGRSTLGGLHHAQLGECAADRIRLVAWRRPVSARCVLCLRGPGTEGP